MKAILVTIQATTRIIVEDDFELDNLTDAEYQTIREDAYPRIHEALISNGVGDNLIEIDEDTECPYDPAIDK